MLPKIDPGILGSVRHEVNGVWIVETLERVRDYDPVMGELMSVIGKKFGIDALGKALLVYRLIESQVEANEMEKLLND